jgi:hypothetical protein
LMPSTGGLCECPRMEIAEHGHLAYRFEMSMRVDFTSVHACTLPRSTCGHFTDIPICAPKKATSWKKKPLALEGFELQSTACTKVQCLTN